MKGNWELTMEDLKEFCKSFKIDFATLTQRDFKNYKNYKGYLILQERSML